jgi:hypothetical protein
VSQQGRKKNRRKKKKFSAAEMTTMQNIVAKLSMKRRSDSEIVKKISKQTNKSLTKRDLYVVKKRVIKEIVDDAKLSWEDISKSDKVNVRKQLMAYQIVLDLGDDTAAREILLSKGYDSAITIIDKNEDEFVETSGLEKGKARMTPDQELDDIQANIAKILTEKRYYFKALFRPSLVNLYHTVTDDGIYCWPINTSEGYIQQGKFGDKENPISWALVYRYDPTQTETIMMNIGDLLVHVPFRERLKWKQYFLGLQPDFKDLDKILFCNFRIPEQRDFFVQFWKDAK